MQLNNDEIRRYSRHLILPEVGMEGQKKIKSTSVGRLTIRDLFQPVQGPFYRILRALNPEGAPGELDLVTDDDVRRIEFSEGKLTLSW